MTLSVFETRFFRSDVVVPAGRMRREPCRTFGHVDPIYCEQGFRKVRGYRQIK